MAKLYGNQLERSLKQLSPVYLVSGDEPLLVQEACDSIRAAARRQGFSEREVFHADTHFNWQLLAESANTLSLFAEQKVIEVRFNGKIPDTGSKVLQHYCSNPNPSSLILLVAPKLDKTATNSAWYKALDKIGQHVALWPLSEKELPRWMQTRLEAAGLTTEPAALQLLCAKVEGNLLAAVQEIEKLKLYCTGETLTEAFMTQAVTDNARFDVFGLVDKTLQGDAAAALRCLHGLKAEGEDSILVIWALAREARVLAAMIESPLQDSKSLEAIARSQGVFDPHFSLMRQALPRFKPAQLRLVLRECALADKATKGASKVNPWDILQEAVLTLAGYKVLSNNSLQQLLR